MIACACGGILEVVLIGKVIPFILAGIIALWSVLRDFKIF